MNMLQLANWLFRILLMIIRSLLLQGTGLGFRVIRMGYDDIYLCAPGSLSQRYGKGYFICTGPASMLVPVVVNPGDEWRAAQVIEHDNL